MRREDNEEALAVLSLENGTGLGERFSEKDRPGSKVATGPVLDCQESQGLKSAVLLSI